jgi:hypothetical protein
MMSLIRSPTEQDFDGLLFLFFFHPWVRISIPPSPARPLQLLLACLMAALLRLLTSHQAFNAVPIRLLTTFFSTSSNFGHPQAPLTPFGGLKTPSL